MSQSSAPRSKRKSPADESARKRRTSTRGQEVSDLHELFDEANQQLQETDALLKEAGKPRRGRAARLPESDDEDIEDAEGEDADNQPPRKQPRAAMYNLHAPRFETLEPGQGRGRAGQIKSLRVENFMCHEHVSVDFKPHVNFISGQNGSGKSAILQALQFCLGVSARNTGRGTAARQLIRTGASHMLASVTLWNTGSDAYLPGYYGPEITVERRVSATSGASSWLLKKADGSKASTSAKDVTAMRDFFTIEPENPAVCLTQDTARTFSGGANAKRKYEVYMDALHFTKIILALNEAKSRVSDMQASLTNFIKMHEEKEAHLRDTESLLESLAEVKGWKERLVHVRNCAAWSSVHVAQAARARLQNKLSMNIPKAQKKLEEDKKAWEEQLADVDAEYNRQQAAFEAFGDNLQAMIDERSRLALGVNEAKRKVSKAQQHVKSMENEITTARAMRDQAVNALSAAEDKNACSTQNAAQAQARRANDMKQATQQADAAEANASAARQGVKEAEALKAQTGQRVAAAGQTHNDALGAVRDVNARFQDLKRFNENPVTAFGGDNVPRLLQLIDRHRRNFHRLPIGPIGTLLSLEDDHWAGAVEQSIGRMFNHFIVHDHHDMQQLKQLGGQVSMRDMQIVVMSFDLPMHDLSRVRQPPAALTTVMRILQFKAEGKALDTLCNILLDHAKMERLALVTGVREGMPLVGSEPTIHQAWGPDGWMGYSRGGSRTSVPAPRNPRNARLQKDVSQLQTDLTQVKARATQQEHQARAALEAAKKQDREAGQALQVAKGHAKSMEDMRRASQVQMSQLATQHQTEPADEGTEEDLTQYHDELRESDARLQEATRQRESVVAAVTEAQAKLQEAKDASQEKEARVRAINDENTANERALQDVADRKQAKAEELDKVKANIMRLQESAAGLQMNIDEAAADIAAAVELAKEVCSQKEDAESLEALLATLNLSEDPAERKGELEKQSKGLESKIRKQETRAGRSLEDLQNDATMLGEKIEVQRLQLTRAKAAYEQLEKGRIQREYNAKYVREDVEKQVNARFNNFLKRRRHAGVIKINYKDHELEMEVEVDKKSHGQKSTNMKSLSGGERSFSTLSFIMAIGEYIQSPFHCLDEFDVFLDTQNRQVAIRMLLEVAKSSLETQFILLSPQDVNSIRHAVDFVHEQAAKVGEELPERDVFTKIVEMRPARIRNGANLAA